ncbi:MAG: AraC family transcriptional regulator [Caldilineaceae bacterium]
MQRKRDEYRMEANRAELVERILRANRADGSIEPLHGLFLNRVSATRRLHSVTNPSFCVIAQGSKAIFLGDERYQYDPAHYLLVTAELPVISQVIDASPQQPYLSFRIELDPILVGTILVETGHSSPQNGVGVRAIDVSALDATLLDAMVRLIRLLDTPAEAPFMAPLITREIVYRLLQGEQGERLRHIAVLGGQHHRMVKAIERLRRNFDQPLRMEEVAGELGMSVSSFHHHFKAVTAMTPLQFQKQLQLQEARRLMLGEDLDATSAGFRVGYNDAAHFNREYKRLFGEPPMRDVARLRTVIHEAVDH